MKVFEIAVENCAFLGVKWDENSHKFVYTKKYIITQFICFKCILLTFLFLIYDAKSFLEYTEALFIFSTAVMCCIISGSVYIQINILSKFYRNSQRVVNTRMKDSASRKIFSESMELVEKCSKIITILSQKMIQCRRKTSIKYTHTSESDDRSTDENRQHNINIKRRKYNNVDSDSDFEMNENHCNISSSSSSISYQYSDDEISDDIKINNKSNNDDDNDFDTAAVIPKVQRDSEFQYLIDLDKRRHDAMYNGENTNDIPGPSTSSSSSSTLSSSTALAVTTRTSSTSSISSISNATPAVDNSSKSTDSEKFDVIYSNDPKRYRQTPILFKCRKCSFNTKFRHCMTRHWENYLSVHNREHRVYKRKKRHQCPECNYKAACPSQLILHRYRKHGVKSEKIIVYTCPECQKYKTITKSDLNIHIRRLHDPLRKRKPECDICGKIFRNRQAIETHMAKRHTTTTSSNSNSSKNKDFDVVQGAIASKKYICNDCNYSSSLVSDFKSHCKSHMPNQPKNFQCKFCNKKFKTERTMQCHLRVWHEQATSKNFTFLMYKATDELPSGFKSASKECAIARPFNFKCGNNITLNQKNTEPHMQTKLSTAIDRLLLAKNRIELNGLLLLATVSSNNDDDVDKNIESKWQLVPETNGRVYIDRTQSKFIVAGNKEPKFRTCTDEELLRYYVMCSISRNNNLCLAQHITIPLQKSTPFIVTGCILPIPHMKFTDANPNDGEIIYTYVIIVPIANANDDDDDDIHKKEYRFRVEWRNVKNTCNEIKCYCMKMVSTRPLITCPHLINSMDGRSFTREFIRSNCLQPMKMIVSKSLSYRLSDGCQYNTSDSFNNCLEFDLNLYNMNDDGDQSEFEQDIRQKNKNIIKELSEVAKRRRSTKQNARDKVAQHNSFEHQILKQIAEKSGTTIINDGGRMPRIDFIISQNLHKCVQHDTVFDYCVRSTVPVLHFTEYNMPKSKIRRLEHETNKKCIQLDNSLLVYRNNDDDINNGNNNNGMCITFEEVQSSNPSYDAILIANISYGGAIERRRRQIWLIASYVSPASYKMINTRLAEICRVLDSIAPGNEIMVFGDLNTTIKHNINGSLFSRGQLPRQLFENLTKTFEKHNNMTERNWHTNYYGHMTDCAYATPKLHVATQVIDSVYDRIDSNNKLRDLPHVGCFNYSIGDDDDGDAITMESKRKTDAEMQKYKKLLPTIKKQTKLQQFFKKKN